MAKEPDTKRVGPQSLCGVNATVDETTKFYVHQTNNLISYRRTITKILLMILKIIPSAKILKHKQSGT